MRSVVPRRASADAVLLSTGLTRDQADLVAEQFSAHSAAGGGGDRLRSHRARLPRGTAIRASRPTTSTTSPRTPRTLHTRHKCWATTHAASRAATVGGRSALRPRRALSRIRHASGVSKPSSAAQRRVRSKRSPARRKCGNGGAQSDNSFARARSDVCWRSSTPDRRERLRRGDVPRTGLGKPNAFTAEERASTPSRTADAA